MANNDVFKLFDRKSPCGEKMLQAMMRAYNVQIFCFQKIGKCCNARRPVPFTSAVCDLKPIYASSDSSAPLTMRFRYLFKPCFQLIADLLNGRRKYEEIDPHFQRAFGILKTFVDNQRHERVWHGFLDIIFSSHEGISDVNETRGIIDLNETAGISDDNETEGISDVNNDTAEKSSDIDGTAAAAVTEPIAKRCRQEDDDDDADDMDDDKTDDESDEEEKALDKAYDESNESDKENTPGGKLTFYLTYEAQNPGENAKSVVSMVHRYFSKYGHGADAKIHFDNCTSQNKNNIVLWYAVWRVIMGTVRLSSENGRNIPHITNNVSFYDWKSFLKKNLQTTDLHSILSPF